MQNQGIKFIHSYMMISFALPDATRRATRCLSSTPPFGNPSFLHSPTPSPSRSSCMQHAPCTLPRHTAELGAHQLGAREKGGRWSYRGKKKRKRKGQDHPPFLCVPPLESSRHSLEPGQRRRGKGRQKFSPCKEGRKASLGRSRSTPAAKDMIACILHLNDHIFSNIFIFLLIFLHLKIYKMHKLKCKIHAIMFLAGQHPDSAPIWWWDSATCLMHPEPG